MLTFLPLIFLQIELVSHLEDYQRSEEEKEAMERQHKVIRRLGASLGCLLGMIYITAYWSKGRPTSLRTVPKVDIHHGKLIERWIQITVDWLNSWNFIVLIDWMVISCHHLVWLFSYTHIRLVAAVYLSTPIVNTFWQHKKSLILFAIKNSKTDCCARNIVLHSSPHHGIGIFTTWSILWFTVDLEQKHEQDLRWSWNFGSLSTDMGSKRVWFVYPWSGNG